MRTFKGYRKSIINTPNQEIASFKVSRNGAKGRYYLRLRTPEGEVFEIEMTDIEAHELVALIIRKRPGEE